MENDSAELVRNVDNISSIGAMKTGNWVVSIPMHFRHLIFQSQIIATTHDARNPVGQR
jgi:hypothetical protein